MKKRSITVRTVTMPARSQCMICGRYGALGPSVFGGAMPAKDRRRAARVDYRLLADESGTYVRLDPRGDPCCVYVCGPCRAALGDRAAARSAR